jgi:hypothetical protein
MMPPIVHHCFLPEVKYSDYSPLVWLLPWCGTVQASDCWMLLTNHIECSTDQTLVDRFEIILAFPSSWIPCERNAEICAVCGLFMWSNWNFSLEMSVFVVRNLPCRCMEVWNCIDIYAWNLNLCGSVSLFRSATSLTSVHAPVFHFMN